MKNCHFRAMLSWTLISRYLDILENNGSGDGSRWSTRWERISAEQFMFFSRSDPVKSFPSRAGKHDSSSSQLRHLHSRLSRRCTICSHHACGRFSFSFLTCFQGLHPHFWIASKVSILIFHLLPRLEATPCHMRKTALVEGGSPISWFFRSNILFLKVAWCWNKYSIVALADYQNNAMVDITW